MNPIQSLDELQNLVLAEDGVKVDSYRPSKSLSEYAWELHRACKETQSHDFEIISIEVASFHLDLRSIDESLAKDSIGPDLKADLSALNDICFTVLQDLHALLSQYHSLSTASQRVWDRMGQEPVSTIRERLRYSNQRLMVFNGSLQSQSQARLEAKLDKFILEQRTGLRAPSVTSQSVESISADNRELWRQLRKDLEDIGISSKVIDERRNFIINWFREAAEAGALEEQEPIRLEDESITQDFYGQTPVNNPLLETEARYPTANVARSTSRTSTSDMGKQKPPKQIKQPSKAAVANNEIIKASREGEIELVEQLLGSVNINAESESGELALHTAVAKGHIAIAELLLFHGADINLVDGVGWTALRWAMGMGYDQIILLLVERNADLEVKDSDGYTVLHWASKRGIDLFVKLLLENNADPNTLDSSGFSALHFAAWNGHSNTVRLLVEMGADLMHKDWWGDTPLNLAARKSHSIIVRILLETARFKDTVSPLLAAEGQSDATMEFFMQQDRLEAIVRDDSLFQDQVVDWIKVIQRRVLQDQKTSELFEHAAVAGPLMKRGRSVKNTYR